MFGEESMRLLREKWGNASMLAQELYAMFQNDIPLSTNAPFTINQKAGAAKPPLTINQYGDGPMVQFNKNGESMGSLVAAGGGVQLQDPNGKNTVGGVVRTVPVWG